MYFPGLFKPADSSKSVLKPGLLGTPANASRQYCLCAARLIHLGLETHANQGSLVSHHAYNKCPLGLAEVEEGILRVMPKMAYVAHAHP